jgi:two-component system nitrogen regulation response regulator GlnG
MADSIYGDQTTLHSAGDEPSARASVFVPALTVLHHPDPSRVGEIALGHPEHDGFTWNVSRVGPPFFAPGTLTGRPLDDPFLTRMPLVLRASGRGGGLQGQVPAKTTVELGGRPAPAVFQVPDNELARGAVLTLAGRVVLLAHRVPGPPGGRSGTGNPASAGLLGASAGILRVREEIGHVADQSVSVLIRGETGTGKELVARAIHQAGPRAKGPFVAVNLGAIPASLMSAELFGHAAGAFTGARQSHTGLFQRAQGGTLLLDEIAEMPTECQAALLRVLEEGTLVPLGAGAPVKLDVRVLASTDADLDHRIAEGEFRAPLLHRLAGYTLHVPPLRERREDIGRLVAHFLVREMQAVGAEVELRRPPEQKPWLSAQLAARLALHDWPGNVRQLANAVRQIVIASRGQTQAQIPAELDQQLNRERASSDAPAPAPVIVKAGEVSDETLLQVLRGCRWSTAEAARTLGISRTTLYALIDRSPRLRKASDIEKDELQSCLRDCGGDVVRAAERLSVSDRALRLRMRTLGLEDSDA